MLRSNQRLLLMRIAHLPNLYQGHYTWWVHPVVLLDSRASRFNLFDIFWCNALFTWTEIINNHNMMLGVLLAMTYSLHHLSFTVGNLSSTNKHRHFAHIWNPLICTNLLAVKTWENTCRWRKNYQWPRTSYGGNSIHHLSHIIHISCQ